MDADRHRKMSKKIAQLTRVIYQLHVRTDDNELELQETADKYEAEINQVSSQQFIISSNPFYFTTVFFTCTHVLLNSIRY